MSAHQIKIELGGRVFVLMELSLVRKQFCKRRMRFFLTMWMSRFLSGGRLACWTMYGVNYMYAQPFVASLHLCTAVCCFIVSFVLGDGQARSLRHWANQSSRKSLAKLPMQNGRQKKVMLFFAFVCELRPKW